ncbi:hypothetical protein [Salipiger sp. PrR003]|uniref:hypothetical protein n=1 Tax=Salipiger sp. PrR003 TaxID=2706776 RepID=UPI0013DC2102|nr:hypothetical protein [Salipiger sp. PrR003]NDV52856.1 hypothetical protein [Salipiger sp. PrR003]
MSETWQPMTRKPAAYRAITCLGADGKEYAGLCFSGHHGEIIEPLSNLAAEPVIGPMGGWKYEAE